MVFIFVLLNWRSHFTKLGLRKRLIYLYSGRFRVDDIVISFTDGFSLTLGNFFKVSKQSRSFLIGCFHRLSDIDSKVPYLIKPFVYRLIRKSLLNRSYSLFLPPNRDYSISYYGLSKHKTSIIRFGVIQVFEPSTNTSDSYIFSMGQDPCRDFDTLIASDISFPVRIHTALRLSIPSSKKNVELTEKLS